MPIDRALLDEVVARNDKQRLAFDDDDDGDDGDDNADDGHRRIRARQGHTVPVDLGLDARPPPAALFHGTVPRALAAIRRDGLLPRGRHHVHLSADVATALAVGGRRGRPVVLRVDSAAMAAAGHAFFLTGNGVWLTDAVSPDFLSLLSDPPAGHDGRGWADRID
ncbi:hypothetical protein GCM10011594_19490 [Nakamurella endophytica]|uniref:RNA 2'-phosphotransferase n=1 Tax=Nakamurella endophytica TaxID=1748367 RepID=A0A917SVH1_9ACTN|nr:hypothetical protein GCM10011594_19490 [Nakamurella endophytica]